MSFASGLVGVIALSAISAGTTVAENVSLDCQVQVRVLSRPDLRELETSDRGVWSLSVYPGESTNVYLSRSNPYLPPNVLINPLNNNDDDAWVTDDAYTFCLEAFGRCGEFCIETYEACAPDITERHMQEGWHSIYEARLDRRRSTFELTIDLYDPVLNAGRRHVYSGPCTRLPDPLF